MFNWKVIGKIIGILLVMNAAFMLLCIPFTLMERDGDLRAILISAAITSGVGGLLMYACRNRTSNELSKRDGFVIVTLGWVSMSAFGALPYIFSGAIPFYADAFFETISGYSTTGATILTDIEAVHKGILFWRSMTHWIGGMGIIVLTVAILPILGIGGMQLFVAESPGISPDKLQPRIKETAKRLWLIYVGLTAVELVLLWACGMSFFDAINHAFATMATGGFSTKNASIAYYSPLIQYIIIVFMFIAGTNFTMIYFGLHGQFMKVLKNEEFRFYLGFTLTVSIIVGLVVYQLGLWSFEESIRNALFQVVSVITTTGFITADYTVWTPFLTVVFFVLLFVGACAGSTAGGVKIVRHLLLVRNSLLDFKRQLHPSAIIPVRFNGRAVSSDIISNILAFIMIYISIFGLGSIALAITGLDFMTAMGATATCLGNVGPGIGTVGPVNNFAHVSIEGKWMLSFLMLVGRLELFTVLILFTPYFWRKI